MYQLAGTVGLFMRFLAPAALVLAALMPWIANRKRASLLERTKQRGESEPLLNLSWKQFESLVAAHFEQEDYHVTLTAAGADGGVDAVAKKDGETFLLQCKQWRATQIGVGVVRELFGVMAAQGATGAYVVSAGPFTRPAVEFAEGRNFEIVDANEIVGTVKRPTAAPAVVQPTCPKCSAEMVKRTAKRGANAENQFWGAQGAQNAEAPRQFLRRIRSIQAYLCSSAYSGITLPERKVMCQSTMRHHAISGKWWPRAESNHRHADFQLERS